MNESSHGDQKPIIFFIHNTLMPYRTPFFKKLTEKYQVNFIFNEINLSKKKYDINFNEEISKFEYKNYIVIEEKFRYIPINLIKILYKGHFNIIVTSYFGIDSFIVLLFAKLKGAESVFWSEDWGWERKKTIIDIVSSPLRKVIQNKASAFLVPGKRHKNYFHSLGVKNENIYILPNASNIQTSINDSKAIKHKYKIKDKKILLFVGRLIERKGLQYLLYALKICLRKNQNIVLFAIGRGPYQNKLVEISKKLNINNNIFFLNNVSNEELVEYYSLCDICIVPSINCHIGDPWVFVLNEAMSFGKPVIATDAVGAAFDLIENGKNGFVVPQKNYEELASSIEIILSNNELENKMGKRSLEIIHTNYEYSNMLSAFDELIKNLGLGKNFYEK